MQLTGALLQQADQAVTARNYFLADKLLAEAKASEPDNPWVYIINSRLCLYRGNAEEARDLLYYALRFEPDHSYVFYLLSRTEYLKRDYPSSYGWICKALEADPGNAEYMGFKALAELTAFDKKTGARATYQAGLAADPGNIVCLVAGYIVESATGNQDIAAGILHRAIGMYPDNADLQAILSEVLQQQGNRDEAIRSILSSLRQVPGSEFYQSRLRKILGSKSRLLSAGNKVIRSAWFALLMKTMILLASFSWLACIYGILFQEMRVLYPVFIVFVLALLVIAFRGVLKAFLDSYLFFFHHTYTQVGIGHLISSFIVWVGWMTAAGLAVMALISKEREVAELCLSLPVFLLIAILCTRRLVTDYREKAPGKIIRHNWFCILTCVIFMLLVLVFPSSGFELVMGFSLPAVLVFLSIRQRWDFEKKYDLSKTVSAYE